ncbi:aldose epimerase [Cohnella pontilimi]|uniref:Aldose epimerase n=1 Tax=Cohnella pontilimi TaxID=2564100 RepID=A0A4U0F7U3_9BACL|nr:aldose epimerase [Cohnella pontilimi]TJY40765.1 aldose epimerase [Cohnella pontilimi]
MGAAPRYEVTSFDDRYTIYELIDRHTDSRVQLCPERGGIVIGCRLNGRELLYLDRETFNDPNANIRGGIPVLFPICGQLREGRYEWEGHVYPMKNHGVARTSVWEVEQTGANHTSAWITLVLRSNEETKISYPFDFELRFTYRLQDEQLSIEQSYSNRSGQPMPMVTGFHPYFATGNKHLPYETDATRYLDYNDGQTKTFQGSVDLGPLKESVALLDPAKPEIAFPLAGDTQVRLRYSHLFRFVVIWSVQGKPFVCVEPWTALNEALNDKKDLLMVQPGDTLTAELHISTGS